MKLNSLQQKIITGITEKYKMLVVLKLNSVKAVLCLLIFPSFIFFVHITVWILNQIIMIIVVIKKFPAKRWKISTEYPGGRHALRSRIKSGYFSKMRIVCSKKPSVQRLCIFVCCFHAMILV